MMNNIILATNNAGKLRELTALFSQATVTLISQASLGITDIAETGKTFIENAIIKARHAAQLSGLPAIADDSGLCVDYLKGAPGIFSARYAGVDANSQNNINKLLQELKFVPEEECTASFYCVIVLLRRADDPTPLICQGKWEGRILKNPMGTQGFGYDPIFYLPSLQKTAAQLEPEVKNKISHRGQAMQQLLNVLSDLKLNESLN